MIGFIQTVIILFCIYPKSTSADVQVGGESDGVAPVIHSKDQMLTLLLLLKGVVFTSNASIRKSHIHGHKPRRALIISTGTFS